MSCEDSLSQSILEPNEIKATSREPLYNTTALLDEVNSLQQDVLKEIEKEGKRTHFFIKIMIIQSFSVLVFLSLTFLSFNSPFL